MEKSVQGEMPGITEAKRLLRTRGHKIKFLSLALLHYSVLGWLKKNGHEFLATSPIER